MVPSLRQKEFQNLKPSIDSAQFVAPNACIIGEVSLEDYSSVWYGAVLRGDRGPITIGKHSVIQDRATLYPLK